MSIQRRYNDITYIGPGPYLARIVNHLDPTYMGSLEVTVLRAIPGLSQTESVNVIVKYCSPFFGTTSLSYEGNNSANFNDVQKSYGFWMVPPDIGSTVMVMFVDGDVNQGYWFGCVPDMYQNQMVPGIAATRYSAMDQSQRDKYGTDLIPVGEYHKTSRTLDDPNPDKFTKPVHPFADRLVEQGLLLDTIRGVTSSSARREVPSRVFGISTPGPVDTSSPLKPAGFNNGSGIMLPVSRLGGHQFVMDDGDTDGKNELFRIRTRTGHQILLHNSSDLIYIANAKGTAWMEFSSNGKLDIYTHDSVSIHSEEDFNFRADRDINLEAGRDINIRAFQNMETNITGYYYLVVDDYAKISIRNDKDETIGQTSRLSIGQDGHIGIAQNAFISSGSDMNILTGAAMKQTAAGDFNVGAAGNYIETAAKIHMNGPTAASADTADAATMPPYLSTFSLPNRDLEYGWANRQFYSTGTISSIMLRVPTHEPYDQHENINPAQFAPPGTDVTLQDRSTSGIAPNPNAGIQSPANPPDVIPGVCDAASASAISAPSAQAGINALKAAATKLGLTSPYAVASLLAIAGGESRWTLKQESFNYSAGRLLQVFPSTFNGNQALAQQYAGNSSQLPEFLYGYNTSKGRGLGNTQPGDGANFIGRGYIQLTGRGNYSKYSKELYNHQLVSSPTALTDNPGLLSSDPNLGAAVSVLYLLDRVKADQNSAGYFEAAVHAVGSNTPDIYKTKKGYYNCFINQLKPKN